MPGTWAHVIPNTAALVGPTEVLPNQDLLPLCSRGEWAFRSCAVLDEHLFHAAEFASLSRGLVLRWSFSDGTLLCVATHIKSLIAYGI
jgi:hypothetical protein